MLLAEEAFVDKKIYINYINILQQELVPALGCTEPIAIAYAAAKAREVLGEFPDCMHIYHILILSLKAVLYSL